MKENYNNYMVLAIQEARNALSSGEGMAFGSVIVKDGEIIAKGHNTVKTSGDPTSHAEVNVIREASKKLKGNLSGCILFSTCEPCLMCFGASVLRGGQGYPK